MFFIRLSIAVSLMMLLMINSISHGQTLYPGQLLNPLIDSGYCGPPPRDENGKIIRREDVKVEFTKQHPCPSTGLREGLCPGWAMDHTRPIACGGCDSVSNLAWLHDSIKSKAASPGFFPKDRAERKIYGQEPPIPDTDNCTYVTPERTLK